VTISVEICKKFSHLTIQNTNRYDVHENQHSDRDIAVGTENRTFLADKVDEISPSMLSRFFRYAFKDF